jgi:hypothetical protein
MQLKRVEQLGFDHSRPGAPAHTGGIVEDQLSRDGSDVLEDGPQPEANALGRLAAVGLHETHVRKREGDDQDMQQLPDPAMMASAWPKSTCAVPAGQTSSAYPSPRARLRALNRFTYRCTAE